MSEEAYFEIGSNAQVDPDVTLGYRYPGDFAPLRIGDDAVIRSGSILYASTVIGNRFQCGHQVLIRAEVTIGDRCVVHHKCTLEGRLRIGDGVKLMAHVYLPSTTTIGDMVFIGPGTSFMNDKYPMRRAAPVEGPTIEDHVSIGGGVTVCPGVTIGRNSVIGAGSVVNKDVPPDRLAYGVPARHYPLPEEISHGNLPELLLPQTDLWGAQSDETWRGEEL
ncbi:acyltransferase [Thalassoglobus polymorphus]|uniref:dTDP-3-amino-3,6-dideoxy-alpha-D-galactopyranose 3-N-acetyltransferase n=1 Tax=Thalassoglobus polymorphus TaxID=2527994 RepID=A0A517QSH4_9PLAN|nr:acyltransferase [Thalassoglobus polymorphus]QDT34590.1 dTDP-3-amino-3,6-dideoxy-alpha-D-galactopyranose 3-N-acetyltransferase [Thalassoglobus polymorphus]